MERAELIQEIVGHILSLAEACAGELEAKVDEILALQEYYIGGATNGNGS